MEQKTFNNIKFTKDKKTGYYLNSTLRKRLHRYVWEYYNGEIPKGYHVHHADHNKDNHDINNLVLMKHDEHASYHGNLSDKEKLQKNLNEKARPKAIEWHKSDEGRAWHKEHYLKYKENLHKEKEFVCECCGIAFTKKDTGQNKFCSNKCKSKYRRDKGLDNKEFTCEKCGSVFIANKYSKRRFCSKSCSKKG